MKSFISNLLSRLGQPRTAVQLATAGVNSIPSTTQPDEGSRTASTNRHRKNRETTEYSTGMELQGLVSGIEHYGIFVRLENGESGLVFHNEVCWPGEDVSYSLNDTVKVMVMAFKPGRGLALSIRETQTLKAFETFSRQYPVGSQLYGQIKSVLDYGVFVTIAPGVSGLVHVSSIPNIKTYGKASIGTSLCVRVANIDQATRRISLELGV